VDSRRPSASLLLLALLLGGAYALTRLWGLPSDWLASATRIAEIGRDLAISRGQPDLLQAWSPLCIANVSYVVLSMPADATFRMGPAAGVDACMEIGVVDGHRVALCRGRGPARFPLTVRNPARSQRYVVDLAACSGDRPAAGAGSARSRGTAPASATLSP
jgi:hypothetical protein